MLSPSLSSAVHTRLAAAFGIDLRTLALFRVVLGAVLLHDSLRRFADLRAFYSDDGLMPRAWLTALEGPLRFSLHAASGGMAWPALLLAIASLAAFCLMIGHRARLAAGISWLLLASLNTRNPLVLIGGDYLMVCLLFWTMFLPVSARYSADAVLARNTPPASNTHVSWASAALILQVLSVYFFGALLKTGAAWQTDASAVYYTLHLDSYSWNHAHGLRDYPALLAMLTRSVWWLELLAAPLALLALLWPGRFARAVRLAVLLLLVGLHLGFLFCLAIGHFPFVSLASLTVLLGGEVWDALVRRRRPVVLHVYYDRDCDFCRKTCGLLHQFLLLGPTVIRPAQDDARAGPLLRAHDSWVVVTPDGRAHLQWAAFVALLAASPLTGWLRPARWGAVLQAPGDAAYRFVARHRRPFARVSAVLLPEGPRAFAAGPRAQALAAVLLGAVLAWNVATLGKLPFGIFQVLSPVLYPLKLEQGWDMFAPAPFTDDGWYVLPGTLENGDTVDVKRPGQPLRFDKPASIAAEFPNMRWQAFEMRLYGSRFRQHRLYWARWLCREWNRNAAPGQRLTEFRIAYMLERTPPPGSPFAPVEQRVLWTQQCSAPPPARASDRDDGAALDGDVWRP